MNDGVLIGLGFFAGWLIRSFFTWRTQRRAELQKRAEVVSKNIYGFMRNNPTRNDRHGLYIVPELKEYIIPLIELHHPNYLVEDTPGQLMIITNPASVHFKRTWCIPYRTKERHLELRNG